VTSSSFAPCDVTHDVIICPTSPQATAASCHHSRAISNVTAAPLPCPFLSVSPTLSSSTSRPTTSSQLLTLWQGGRDASWAEPPPPLLLQAGAVSVAAA